MFDHQQRHPLHTVLPSHPHLRPDLMRAEHVERLRRRDVEQQEVVWKSARQGIMQLAERIAVHIGTGLLRWVEQRKLRLQQKHS